MRKTVLILSLLNTTIFLDAQVSPADSIFAGKTVNNAYHDYSHLKSFLLMQKNNTGVFLAQVKPQWNSNPYQDQYQQLLTINKKNEFYPVLQFDSRFISQSVPTRYGSQNFMWISTQPGYKNLGEEIVGDVISGVAGSLINGKKHRYISTGNKKGYYTPAGLKF